MARLIFIDDKFSGQTYDLKREKTLIGRGDQNHLIIPDSSVSAQHCMILANGPEVLLCELDSSNGTYVDGNRVAKQTQIKSGQTLRIGSVLARLELGANDEFTDTEEMTAVLGYRRAMQNAPSSKAPQEAPPTRLQTHAPADSDEPTIAVRPPMAKPLPQPFPPQNSVRSSHPATPAALGSRWLPLVLTGAGILLLLLGWLLWGKK